MYWFQLQTSLYEVESSPFLFDVRFLLKIFIVLARTPARQLAVQHAADRPSLQLKQPPQGQNTHPGFSLSFLPRWYCPREILRPRGQHVPARQQEGSHAPALLARLGDVGSEPPPPCKFPGSDNVGPFFSAVMGPVFSLPAGSQAASAANGGTPKTLPLSPRLHGPYRLAHINSHDQPYFRRRNRVCTLPCWFFGSMSHSLTLASCNGVGSAVRFFVCFRDLHYLGIVACQQVVSRRARNRGGKKGPLRV